MSWSLQEFKSASELDAALAARVGEGLRSYVKEKGSAVLAVSGGKTPAGFFDSLSRETLDWDRTTITLVDDRCLPEDAQDSNARLVKQLLLQNQASLARFLPLYDGHSETPDLAALEAQFRSLNCFPLDIVILGMGNDGHTASLFPCAENIGMLMQDTGARLFYEVQPATAPYRRITFSLPALLASGRILLHLVGDAKREVLEQALAGTSTIEMPIRAFLNHPTVAVDIVWAP